MSLQVRADFVTERVKPDQYYTDGVRLYRIVQVNYKEWTVLVENCETLYTHLINLETVDEGWTEVIYDG